MTMKILTWAINALCYIQRTYESAGKWQKLDNVSESKTTWDELRPMLPYDARHIIQNHMEDKKNEIIQQCR